MIAMQGCDLREGGGGGGVRFESFSPFFVSVWIFDSITVHLAYCLRG